MSHNLPQPNDPWGQQPQPPRRETNWAKGLLIGCLIVGGVLALLCCGGGAYLFYSMQPTLVQQPAEVRQMAAEVAEIETPEGLEPTQGFKMKILFVANLRGVVYESKGGKDGRMLLMEFDAAIEGIDPKQMRQAMSQGIGDADKNISIKKSATREFTIRGSPCPFTFSEGENTETHQAVRVVTGTFPSKNKGVVILWMVVPAERYDEAEIERMIKSIK